MGNPQLKDLCIYYSTQSGIHKKIKVIMAKLQ